MKIQHSIDSLRKSAKREKRNRRDPDAAVVASILDIIADGLEDVGLSELDAGNEQEDDKQT